MTAAPAVPQSLGRKDRIRRSLGFRILVLLSPSLLWLIIFFVLPLVIVFIYSFLKRGPYGDIRWEFNLQNYVRFFDPLYLKIFLRSFKIAAITTVICFLLGYPMAYWLATRPKKWRNTLLLLIMIPFWTNFLIRTYAWILILQDTGLVNQFLQNLGVITRYDDVIQGFRRHGRLNAIGDHRLSHENPGVFMWQATGSGASNYRSDHFRSGHVFRAP